MNQRFINWLNEQMSEAGLNQNELAQRSGLYPSNISMVLTGDKEPGINFFIKVAKGLRLPPGQVFEQYALPISEKPTRDQLLATKVSGVISLFAELGHSGEVQLVYEFAEMLLKRQGVPLPTQAADAQEDNLPGELPNPKMEDVMNILQCMDQSELQNTYDYARWRLTEQGARRNSTGKRQGEKKRKEREDIIGLIDLYLAVDEAPQEKIDSFIAALTEWYFLQQENEQENDNQIVASQPPQHNSGQLPQQDQE